MTRYPTPEEADAQLAAEHDQTTEDWRRALEEARHDNEENGR